MPRQGRPEVDSLGNLFPAIVDDQEAMGANAGSTDKHSFFDVD